MLFNSWEFAVLFVVTAVAYRFLRSVGWRQWALLGASYAFYAAWDWRFLSLIWLSTLVDYTAALYMRRSPHRRGMLLATSIFVNLGILGTFKYFGFFAESAAQFLNSFGLQLNPSTASLILPVGISFYTFQTMAYTIDVWRGRVEPETNLRQFALYVAFFPQLVAGPIETPRHLMPQLAALATPRGGQVFDGLLLFLTGLLRKVLIADTIAAFVDPVFAGPGTASSADLAIATILFGLQIYADFAGYTDMARGLALMFGVDLIVNFRQPYFATSLADFWRRWHISLSTWLREYLYIPLGGNRGSKAATYRNLMVTMLLGGLWHGASWNFVIWGGLHGVGLAWERWRADRGRQFGALSGWVVTMLIVFAAWIFFRAPTLDVAWSAVVGIASVRGAVSASLLGVLAAAVAATLLLDHPDALWSEPRIVRSWSAARRGAYYALAVLVLVLAAPAAEIPFLYFQF
ncbi:MAG: MBOAT family protein [bacterium]|nr:MBOAT family protein [bacterium]